MAVVRLGCMAKSREPAVTIGDATAATRQSLHQHQETTLGNFSAKLVLDMNLDNLLE